MKTMFKMLGLLAVALGLALPVASDTVETRRYPLAIAFDLDGEAADADQVVASVALTDSASFTIAANPDVCRLVDITVTDADSSITAGVLTATGTDCYGDALVATFTFAAGGSGVKTLVVSQSTYKASGAYFKTVTAVTTGVLTGEGAGDAVTVGYTSNSNYTYLAFGRQAENGTRRFIDIGGFYTVNYLVTLSSVTLTAATATQDPFQWAAVGDLLYFNVNGVIERRRVATVASADSITIDSTIENFPSAGLAFKYQRRFLMADPEDGWIAMQGFQGVSFVWQVLANTNTGGVVSDVSCRADVDSLYPQVQVDTDTVATGATGSVITAIDLTLAPYAQCRFGLKFGTGDDDDTGIETIYASLIATK